MGMPGSTSSRGTAQSRHVPNSLALLPTTTACSWSPACATWAPTFAASLSPLHPLKGLTRCELFNLVGCVQCDLAGREVDSCRYAALYFAPCNVATECMMHHPYPDAHSLSIAAPHPSAPCSNSAGVAMIFFMFAAMAWTQIPKAASMVLGLVFWLKHRKFPAGPTPDDKFAGVVWAVMEKVRSSAEACDCMRYEHHSSGQINRCRTASDSVLQARAACGHLRGCKGFAPASPCIGHAGTEACHLSFFASCCHAPVALAGPSHTGPQVL